VVEVSPPFDAYTALNGVTMMWEFLCIMADGVASKRT
jgi:hypothetical protein